MAACIPRTKATKRVALSALMAWSGRALPGLADPHRALAGYRAIPALVDGGHPGENAPAPGQHRDALPITERVDRRDMQQGSEGPGIVSEATQTAPDWSAWSQEAVRLMQERNGKWIRSYSLEGCAYQWRLDDAQLVFRSESDEVVSDICVIGSVSRSEGTFCWAWANEAIPSCAQHDLARVREFGKVRALELLTRPQWPGGRPEGLEMAAVAGRILDADGIWIEETDDVTLFFALSNFRRRSSERLRKGSQRGRVCR